MAKSKKPSGEKSKKAPAAKAAKDTKPKGPAPASYTPRALRPEVIVQQRNELLRAHQHTWSLAASGIPGEYTIGIVGQFPQVLDVKVEKVDGEKSVFYIIRDFTGQNPSGTFVPHKWLMMDTAKCWFKEGDLGRRQRELLDFCKRALAEQIVAEKQLESVAEPLTELMPANVKPIEEMGAKERMKVERREAEARTAAELAAEAEKQYVRELKAWSSALTDPMISTSVLSLVCGREGVYRFGNAESGRVIMAVEAETLAGIKVSQARVMFVEKKHSMYGALVIGSYIKLHYLKQDVCQVGDARNLHRFIRELAMASGIKAKPGNAVQQRIAA